MTKKIVVSYAGPDAAARLRRLKEVHGLPVVAVVADLGPAGDGGAESRQATKAGADKVVLTDLRDEFARDFVFAALKAGALGRVPALARPLVARVLFKVARSENAAVAHGAAGDEEIHLELARQALAPDLETLPPAFANRAEALAYAEKHGLASDGRAGETTLLGAAYEGGGLEDPWAEAPAELFRMTKDPAQAPEAAEAVEIEFVDGAPAAVDREPLAPAKLLLKLNEIAGRHGVGREDVVETRAAGQKVRVAREAPGARVLELAHAAVESLTMDRQVASLRDGLTPGFVAGVRDGLWFSPEMAALRAVFEECRKGVTGVARIRMHKGLASVAGRKSPNAPGASAPAGADAGGFARVAGARLALNKSLRRAL